VFPFQRKLAKKVKETKGPAKRVASVCGEIGVRLAPIASAALDASASATVNWCHVVSSVVRTVRFLTTEKENTAMNEEPISKFEEEPGWKHVEKQRGTHTLHQPIAFRKPCPCFGKELAIVFATERRDQRDMFWKTLSKALCDNW
jgi:hypothetical protein